jgi:hypothetical protein
MKHRPLLYLETSVFGFYYDEEPRNVLRREAVVALFKQIGAGILDAFTSPLTLSELNRTQDPRHAHEGHPAIRIRTPEEVLDYED